MVGQFPQLVLELLTLKHAVTGLFYTLGGIRSYTAGFSLLFYVISSHCLVQLVVIRSQHVGALFYRGGPLALFYGKFSYLV